MIGVGNVCLDPLKLWPMEVPWMSSVQKGTILSFNLNIHPLCSDRESYCLLCITKWTATSRPTWLLTLKPHHVLSQNLWVSCLSSSYFKVPSEQRNSEILKIIKPPWNNKIDHPSNFFIVLQKGGDVSWIVYLLRLTMGICVGFYFYFILIGPNRRKRIICLAVFVLLDFLVLRICHFASQPFDFMKPVKWKVGIYW